jgi:S-DNA-T family DNA segregation ATPase FtsK/SpoIIIE
LPIFLGVDNSGDGIFFDLAKAPHILIGGTTGAGKSVCINTILASLLMMNDEQEFALSLIDVKKVELAKFTSCPHLRQQIATETDSAIYVLNSLVEEMEYRYNELASRGAVSVDEYPIFKRSILVIDELADLVLTGGQAVLKPLTRLLQKGRGAGIHCILATQNPTVKVIDGIIKANCPTRIAFKTASLVDSRVILDLKGAEKLTHKGEFLAVLPSGITQGQCALTTNEEIQKILNEYKKEF